MPNDAQPPATSSLSYLAASKVTSPAGVLSELDLLTVAGKRLGSIEGVVIDAAARCVRYLDVQSSSWFGRGRYLVEADQIAQLEAERKALRLRVDIKDESIHSLDVAGLHQFSDDDLLAALFTSRAA